MVPEHAEWSGKAVVLEDGALLQHVGRYLGSLRYLLQASEKRRLNDETWTTLATRPPSSSTRSGLSNRDQG